MRVGNGRRGRRMAVLVLPFLVAGLSLGCLMPVAAAVRVAHRPSASPSWARSASQSGTL